MATKFPNGWATMEIEAKWDATEATFNSIITAFPDGGSKYGYNLNVRWGGVPRRYTDVYYDNPASDLFSALHVIRHRQRHRTLSTVAITDSFANLDSAGWPTLNWHKVQYKSTPTRLAAVWFRTEQGDAELTTVQVTSTLAGTAPTPPYTATDNPVDLLLGDHPGFDFSQLTEVLDVVQYRYRVEFLDPGSGDPLYELSLDKVVTTAPGTSPVYSYSIELEALKAGSHVESSIDRLLALMLLLEEEFGLTRATQSKGGVHIDDTAEPEMRLETTTLDYRMVEIGFAYTKAIVVYNDGYAPLNVTVTNQSTGDPDAAQWVILEHTTPIEVPVGPVPLTVIEVFEPDAVGSYSIEFLVAGDDPAYLQQTVTLIGEGVSPTPIDSVLVLDRSGSMDESAGERRKIDAMRDAADLYAHLLRQDAGGGTGDRIGLVKYNDNNSTYLELKLVDDPSTPGSHMEELESKLSDAALADGARLMPQGATWIGGAMQTAAGLFSVPAGDRRHVMVVLTDGKENQTPGIADVVGPIQVANADLSMYSVGVGDNFDEDKLQLITNAGNGYHQVSGDLSGLRIFDLEMFYFKIFASAAGMDLAADPTVAVPLGGDQPIVVHRARVTSSDRSAIFIILDSPVLRNFYDLELIAPNGQVMGPGVLAGGSTVHYLQRQTYTICKVILPNAATNAELLGDWVLRLTQRGWNADKLAAHLRDERHVLGWVREHPKKALAPVGFAAAVASNYRMRVQVTAPSYTPGSRVLLMATLTDQGWPTAGGKVQVDVTAPDGTLVQTIQLRHDGNSTWVGEFILTQAPGSYRFLFRSRGRNGFGEAVPREASRVVTLMPPARDSLPATHAGLRGWLFWIVAVFLALLGVSVLLLWILRMVYT